MLAGERTKAEALARYAAFHDAHAPAFRRALRLQRVLPALPPRLLTARPARAAGAAPGRPRLRLVSRPGAPRVRVPRLNPRSRRADDERVRAAPEDIEQLQARLTEAERRYSTLVEHLPVVTYVAAFDAAGTLL